MSASDRPVQDIRISDEDVNRMLDRLDDAEIRVRKSERRSVRRYLRGTAIVATVLRPDASADVYRGRIRNISDHGVAILSPVALAPDTQL